MDQQQTYHENNDRSQKTVLVTGGAGFIGSHLCDELIRGGYHVRVLDNLTPQVHGADAGIPSYLHPEVEFIYGDVRNPQAVHYALHDVHAVFHLAAAVGVGQSMYEIEKYTNINNLGTAVLLEELIKHPVEKLVVASSMSIYGEGLYLQDDDSPVWDLQRSHQQLKEARWEPVGSDHQQLHPVATPENKPPSLTSVYALSKYDQERMCLMTGRAYNIPTVALRFFNVFGIRQALSNPYTGVLAIFASRYLNDKPPLIFEDGYQQRDFVSVYDIARACRLAYEVPEAVDQVFNIGSGRAFTIREVALLMQKVLDKKDLDPVVSGKYRVGDIRHCFADISRAQRILHYQPRVSLEDGLDELAQWLKGQVVQDQFDDASRELERRGLTL